MNISSETIDFIQITVQIVQFLHHCSFNQIIVQIVQRWIVLFFQSDHCSNCSIFTAYKKSTAMSAFLF